MKKLFKLATLILVVAMLAGLLIPVATASAPPNEAAETGPAPLPNAGGNLVAGWVRLANDNWAYNIVTGSRVETVGEGDDAVRHVVLTLRGARGWNTIDGVAYYFLNPADLANVYGNDDLQEGYMARNASVRLDGVVFRFGGGGTIADGGWTRIGSDWAYFGANGVQVANRWILDNGSWYRIGANGLMLTGWENIDSHWYFFNSNGVMQTGWLRTGGEWYLLHAEGHLQVGWHILDGYWYWMDPANGVMQTGPRLIGGTTFRFNSNGQLQETVQAAPATPDQPNRP